MATVTYLDLTKSSSPTVASSTSTTKLMTTLDTSLTSPTKEKLRPTTTNLPTKPLPTQHQPTKLLLTLHQPTKLLLIPLPLTTPQPTRLNTKFPTGIDS